MNLRLLSLSFLLVGCGHLGLELDEGEDAARSALGPGGSGSLGNGNGGSGLATGDGDGSTDVGDGDGDVSLGGSTGSGGDHSSGGTGGTGSATGSGGDDGSGGTPNSGGQTGCTKDCTRIKDGLILLYDFNETQGSVAFDTSAFLPQLNLGLPAGDVVTWVDSGLRLNGPTLLTSAVPAQKLTDAVKLTNEISFEAWVQSADAMQGGPARFFTMSVGSTDRNFMLAQDTGHYLARLRTSGTDNNGKPDLVSEFTVTNELTHVVFTHAENGDELLFVNGVESASGSRPGTFSNWESGYHLGVGDEFGGDRDWQGTIYLLAVYNRALTQDEVQANARSAH